MRGGALYFKRTKGWLRLYSLVVPSELPARITLASNAYQRRKKLLRRCSWLGMPYRRPSNALAKPGPTVSQEPFAPGRKGLALLDKHLPGEGDVFGAVYVGADFGVAGRDGAGAAAVSKQARNALLQKGHGENGGSEGLGE